MSSSIHETGFVEVMPVSDVKKIIHETAKEFVATFQSFVEEIETFEASGRVLAETIHSPINLPRYRRSAMDGYAVYADDTYGAGENSPLKLKVVGKVEIGDTETINFQKGETIRISTGAPVPDCATAVIKIEDVTQRGDFIDIESSVPEGKNISQIGENVKKGDLILPRYHMVRPIDISMLYDLGYNKVRVIRKLKAGVFSTGSELIDHKTGQQPKFGQIVDSNRPGLLAYLKCIGAEPVDLGLVRDDKELIENTMKDNSCDIIITTGGTSVGTMDLLPEIVKEKGKLDVHGVAIRPGKPFGFGRIFGKFIFLLPGYPLASFLNFELFVVYFHELVYRTKLLNRAQEKVILTQRVASKSGYRDFVRLKKVGERDGMALVAVIKITGAGILSSLTSADYLLQVPEDLEGYPANSVVTTTKLR